MGARPAICVTGATGYIASVIRDNSNLFSEYRLVFLSNSDDSCSTKIDWSDAASVSNAINGSDIVIHAASMNQYDAAADPDGAFDYNVEKTIFLFRECAKINVKKFIFLSTIQVYGDSHESQDEHIVNLKPVSIYAQTKYMAERRLLAESELLKTDLYILRLGNVFGFRRGYKNKGLGLVLNEFMYDSLHNRSITIKGNANAVRPFITTEFFIDVLKSFVVCNGYPTGVYNVTGNLCYSIKKCAMLIKKIMKKIHGVDVNINQLYLSDDKIDSKSYNAKKLDSLGIKRNNRLSREIANTLYCI